MRYVDIQKTWCENKAEVDPQELGRGDSKMCQVEPPGTIYRRRVDELHLELAVAGGAVHGDEGGEDAQQEEDEDQVLDEANVLERDHLHNVHIGKSKMSDLKHSFV